MWDPARTQQPDVFGFKFKKMERASSIRDDILANVNNLDLNIRRAKRLWKADDMTERDIAQAKDDFSKTKFTYLELLTKNQFILNIAENQGIVPDSSDLEENLAQFKATLKKSKGRCKTLKTELETMIQDVCRKEIELQADAAQFANESLQDSSHGCSEKNDVIQEFQKNIEAKKSKLDEQGQSIFELNRQKTELELSVKGLDSKLASINQPDHSRLIAHRMAIWFLKANSVLQEICGVESVHVGESEVHSNFRNFLQK
jgi:chromosome segregation ATPase